MTDLKDLMEQAVAHAPAETHSTRDIVAAAQRDQRRRTTGLVAAAVAGIVAVSGLTYAATQRDSDRDRIEPAGPVQVDLDDAQVALEGTDYEVVQRPRMKGYALAGVVADGSAVMTGPGNRTVLIDRDGAVEAVPREAPPKSVLSQEWLDWWAEPRVPTFEGVGSTQPIPDPQSWPGWESEDFGGNGPAIDRVVLSGDRLWITAVNLDPEQGPEFALFSVARDDPSDLRREVDGWVEAAAVGTEGAAWTVGGRLYVQAVDSESREADTDGCRANLVRGSEVLSRGIAVVTECDGDWGAAVVDLEGQERMTVRGKVYPVVTPRDVVLLDTGADAVYLVDPDDGRARRIDGPTAGAIQDGYASGSYVWLARGPGNDVILRLLD